jgi:hypothetical protein
MINTTIDVDLRQFTRGMDEAQQRQVPFATMRALDAVGLDVQKRERARLREAFDIRRDLFADRSIKLTHKAKKTELYTTIAIAPPGGDGGRPNVFSKFESETVKTPYGAHGIAIPLKDGQIRKGIIPNSQKPAAFALHREGNRIVGLKGTYVVRLSNGRELLLQRKDMGKRAQKKAGRRTRDDSIILFLFVPKVKVNPTLRFVPSAGEVIDRAWEPRFTEMFAAAMATAR